MLLFKIILAPVLIGLVSLAGRRWGPGIAGWLLGLPLNSAPILFFLLLEQGPGFASSAARGTLLGILGWAAFCLTYAHCCVRLSWWWSTLAGWMAYFVASFALLPVKLSAVWIFAMVSVALIVIFLTFPKALPADSPSRNQPGKELWLRMATASVMVVSLTEVATLLGPTRSGMLSAFPAYTTILAVFSHLDGPAAAVRTLKGVTAGLYTSATFLLTLALSLTHLSGVLSFTLAGIAALAVQAGSFVYVRRNG